MSSILDALKRLENEGRNAAEASPASWVEGAEAPPGRLTRLQEVLLVQGRKWLTASALLAALVVAVWIGWRVISIKPEASPPVPAAIPPETKPMPAQAPPVERSKADPGMSRAEPARRPPAKTAPLASPMPWAESHSTPIIAPPPTPKASPPALAPPPSDGSLPPLPAEIGLSLQAVSWAARAQDRIAVVNGQIMRQGDDIDGYTVRDIDADAVVLCRSGECYRLAFAFGK